MNNEKEILTLNNLRIPLLLGVVMIHSNVISFTGQAMSRFSAFNSFMEVWNHILNLMVPAFFFISGYMFFRTGFLLPHSYFQKLKRRSRSLLIPYLLWNCIGLILTAVKTLPQFAGKLPQYEHLFDSPFTLIAGFFALPHTGSPYDMPLWFLRNLMIVILISPVISLAFKYLKSAALISISFFFLISDDIPFALQNTLWFFSLGAAIPLLEVDLMQFTKKIWMWLFLYIACIVITLTDLFTLYPFITQTCGIFLLIAISNRFLSSFNFSGTARAAAFFIFACHGLYAIPIDRFAAGVIAHMTLQSAPSPNPLFQFMMQVFPFICYILCFAINTGIAWGIFLLMTRIAPKTTGILCGGR